MDRIRLFEDGITWNAVFVRGKTARFLAKLDQGVAVNLGIPAIVSRRIVESLIASMNPHLEIGAWLE